MNVFPYSLPPPIYTNNPNWMGDVHLNNRAIPRDKNVMYSVAKLIKVIISLFSHTVFLGSTFVFIAPKFAFYLALS
jgi:hypothetical protein